MDQKQLNELRQQLAAAFAQKWAGEDQPQYSELHEKFLFHMLDAAEEICRIDEILTNSAAVPPAEFAKYLHRFFLHALPHLVAAGQLYDYVPNIFSEQHGVHSLPTAASHLK